MKSKITLKHKTFLDIGCGDMFLYPNLINNEISEYYGFDINKKNIEHGLKYLKKKKIKIYPDKIEIGSNFGFENINQESIDIAFAQAVTSHLNINSLIVLLRNLKKKMKKDGRFFTSFILIDRSKDNEPNIIEWNKINKFNNEPHLVTSYFERDPYHYSVETLKNISQMCGWVYIGEYDYDHDIQRMVEFKII